MALTYAQVLKFDPAQPRDAKGRWMTVAGAKALAQELHAGQFEKYAPETPFFTHLERVVAGVEGETATVAAYLHDSVEEGKITLEGLIAKGASPEQAAAIDVVTRRAGEKYFDYIERVATSGNPAAIQVKRSDLKTHFAHGTLPESLHKRYTKALARMERV